MAPGSWLNYVRIGARLSLLESLLVYLAPVVLACSPYSGFFLFHAGLQLAWFLVIVQLPALVTCRMSYVDIGWPWGLVLLSVSTYIYGTGYWVRKAAICGCLLLHGGRMGLGALAMFFPYRFPEDLPRYQYAKVRWEGQDGMPPSGWWLKIQHDTLQQAFANSATLAVPIVLCAFNPSKTLHPLECLGCVAWLLSWCLESLADAQKLAFVEDCKSRAKAPGGSAEEKARLKGACLGFGDFGGARYFLWAWSRHPNYFFEWCCWNSFCLAALPSLWALFETGTVSVLVFIGLVGVLALVSRVFYDCLLYWTGAEPAEYFSVQKRPQFKEYQAKVNVFFPFNIPYFAHHRQRGWPLSEKTT